MIPVTLNLDNALAEIPGESRRPLDGMALGLIVLGLYRLGRLLSGKSAALLGMSRINFIKHACGLDISYLRYDATDLDSEIQLGLSLVNGSQGESIRGAR